MKSTNRYNQLTGGNVIQFPHHSLFLTRSGADGCDIRVNDKESTKVFTLAGEQQGLLALAPATLTVERGQFEYLFLDFTHLAKLQVFIDKSQNRESEHRPRTLFGYVPAELDAHPTPKDIEYWLLNQALYRAQGLTLFSDVLRQSEWYALVAFLFDAYRTNSSQRLQILCLRYGLSVSHFRRLSRRALGNTAKAALRDWRLGQALLELIDGENNLTTIAMNHGYASLSHFSNDVKDVLGMSPRNLKKLLQAS